MSARVSIVIPTWNRKALLAACLDSLAAQTFQDFEVIVVDDGSTDDTAAMVERQYPAVRLVRLPENRGFCVAVNAGLRQVDGELVLLLNNDMTLARDCLAQLVGAAAASETAMFAPLVLWRDDPDTIYGAGDRQRQDGRPESIGFRCPLEGFRFPETVFGVSGGAGLYRRDVFDRVGPLDERFVAYFEDSDLSFRARLAGFRAAFVREAVAYHVGSASLEGRTWWRARQCYRNHALLVLKNMPASLLRQNARVILAERRHQVVRAFSATRAEFGAARAMAIMVSAWLSILRQLPHVFAERRRIGRLAVIEDEELAALLEEPES